MARKGLVLSVAAPVGCGTLGSLRGLCLPLGHIPHETRGARPLALRGQEESRAPLRP